MYCLKDVSKYRFKAVLLKLGIWGRLVGSKVGCDVRQGSFDEASLYPAQALGYRIRMVAPWIPKSYQHVLQCWYSKNLYSAIVRTCILQLRSLFYQFAQNWR